MDVYKTGESSDGIKYDLEYFKKICGEDVYVVRTASGGFHLFFVYEDKLDKFRNWNGIQGFIDVKTTKGQVAGRGSKTEKGVYTLINGDINKLTKIPDTLYTLLEDGVVKLGFFDTKTSTSTKWVQSSKSRRTKLRRHSKPKGLAGYAGYTPNGFGATKTVQPVPFVKTSTTATSTSSNTIPIQEIIV